MISADMTIKQQDNQKQTHIYIPSNSTPHHEFSILSSHGEKNLTAFLRESINILDDCGL